MGFFKTLVLTEKMKNKFTLSNHNDVPSPRNNYEAKVVKKNLTQEKGFADYWFIGNSKDLDKFSDLYDKNILSYQSTFCVNAACKIP